MSTLKHKLESFPADTTRLDLSNEELTTVVSLIPRFHNIVVVDISDNNGHEHTKAVIISNNWLLENSLAFIQDVMIEHNITTLKILNENSILHLCGLKISSIENLYLNDNSIGNVGLQFLLTTLLHNNSIKRLYLCNNNISDSGVVSLCDFLLHNKKLQYVDIQNNSIYKYSSVRMLNIVNSSSSTPRIEFSIPDPERHALGISPYVSNKRFRDCCVVFQLLHYILKLEGIPSPLCIPHELIFKPAFQSHRNQFLTIDDFLERIIKKLVESPSALAQRIDTLIDYLCQFSEEDQNPILNLINDNIPLLCIYLQQSPVLKTTISSKPLLSSSSSSSSSSISSGNENHDNFEISKDFPSVSFAYELGPTIHLTVGRIMRSGIVKVKLIRLLECVILKLNLNTINKIVVSKLNLSILNLFILHPWSSFIHEAVTSYFETVLACHNSSLNFDVIANCGLAHFIMKQLLNEQNRNKIVYSGFLIRLSVAIQHVFVQQGNLFFKLYECNDKECIQSELKHPITRDSWNHFYKTFVVDHKNLCLFEV